MAYEKPITIAEVIENIQKKKYVLPAIQREFVWESLQIEMLFDSLLRDYPISTFLFWHVDKARINDFQFYEFLKHYHERDSTHNPKASLANDEDIIAILDGQQRLTSLYISLKGTYAEKLRYYSWDKNYSFPRKKLYLNLIKQSDKVEMLYDFKFLTEEEVTNPEPDNYWFEVGRILDFKEYPDVMKYLLTTGLTDTSKFSKVQAEFAMSSINNLYNAIQQKGVINFFLEKNSELDKVLQIFIRINSGGTKLSYSDLLLSIATAQWKEKDAREEINGFVDELNKLGQGFDFDKDFILKSCLVLGDFSDVKFKVDNFTKTNMLKIEELWPKITRAIRTSVILVSTFGFNRETLTSYNALIPIAYYLLKTDAGDPFIHQSTSENQRKAIFKWLISALLKRTFSGTPDNLYPQFRKLINDAGGEFPLNAIIEFYKGTNKSIIFSDDDINALCDLDYGNKYTFSALALLYPELNLKFTFHLDHIFPKTFFTDKKLKKRGLNENQVEFYLNSFNNLANLQLLEGTENKEKSSTEFNIWLNKKYSTDAQKQAYFQFNFIPKDILYEFNNFELFFTKRNELIKIKFKEILKVKDEKVEVIQLD